MINNYELFEDEICTICKDIKKYLNGGGIVLIRGDLASGKTSLVKEFAKLLGLKISVTSPTFSLQSVYDEVLYHYDIYNKGVDNFLELGLLDELSKEGYHFIEWADEKMQNIVKVSGFKYVVIDIYKKDDKREYRVNYE